MAEEHITYEIERLVFVLPIQAQVASFVHPIITQSLLEAFLVHLRSLADFVAAPKRPRHEMDVAAEDYYDGTCKDGFTFWGYATPAIDLRRRGELRASTLLASYGRLAQLIPRAIGRSTGGGLRHPLKWDGPIGAHVVLVVFFLLLTVLGTIRIVVGPDRTGVLRWTPLFLFTGVGLGILLVRETPALEDGNHARPMPPAEKGRQS